MNRPVQRDKVTGRPAADFPVNCPPPSVSCANSILSRSAMVRVRVSCANVQRLLVKNLPGQPPSGTMDPLTRPGAPPNSMPQGGAPVADNSQRPLMSDCGVGGAGAGPCSVAQALSISAATRAPAIDARMRSLHRRDHELRALLDARRPA